ncbi:unnamed protein product [Amoebophrya sp. A120]|nr:unnamed protein product [Amoebophrya sp. A120]|eukprot:GSA120T00021229001.1
MSSSVQHLTSRLDRKEIEMLNRTYAMPLAEQIHHLHAEQNSATSDETERDRMNALFSDENEPADRDEQQEQQNYNGMLDLRIQQTMACLRIQQTRRQAANGSAQRREVTRTGQTTIAALREADFNKFILPLILRSRSQSHSQQQRDASASSTARGSSSSDGDHHTAKLPVLSEREPAPFTNWDEFVRVLDQERTNLYNEPEDAVQVDFNDGGLSSPPTSADVAVQDVFREQNSFEQNAFPGETLLPQEVDNIRRPLAERSVSWIPEHPIKFGPDPRDFLRHLRQEPVPIQRLRVEQNLNGTTNKKEKRDRLVFFARDNEPAESDGQQKEQDEKMMALRLQALHKVAAANEDLDAAEKQLKEAQANVDAKRMQVQKHLHEDGDLLQELINLPQEEALATQLQRIFRHVPHLENPSLASSFRPASTLSEDVPMAGMTPDDSQERPRDRITFPMHDVNTCPAVQQPFVEVDDQGMNSGLLTNYSHAKKPIKWDAPSGNVTQETSSMRKQLLLEVPCHGRLVDGEQCPELAAMAADADHMAMKRSFPVPGTSTSAAFEPQSDVPPPPPEVRGPPSVRFTNAGDELLFNFHPDFGAPGKLLTADEPTVKDACEAFNSFVYRTGQEYEHFIQREELLESKWYQSDDPSDETGCSRVDFPVVRMHFDGLPDTANEVLRRCLITPEFCGELRVKGFRSSQPDQVVGFVRQGFHFDLFFTTRFLHTLSYRDAYPVKFLQGPTSNEELAARCIRAEGDRCLRMKYTAAELQALLDWISPRFRDISGATAEREHRDADHARWDEDRASGRLTDIIPERRARSLLSTGDGPYFEFATGFSKKSVLEAFDGISLQDGEVVVELDCDASERDFFLHVADVWAHREVQWDSRAWGKQVLVRHASHVLETAKRLIDQYFVKEELRKRFPRHDPLLAKFDLMDPYYLRHCIRDCFQTSAGGTKLLFFCNGEQLDPTSDMPIADLLAAPHCSDGDEVDRETAEEQELQIFVVTQPLTGNWKYLE